MITGIDQGETVLIRGLSLLLINTSLRVHGRRQQVVACEDRVWWQWNFLNGWFSGHCGVSSHQWPVVKYCLITPHEVDWIVVLITSYGYDLGIISINVAFLSLISLIPMPGNEVRVWWDKLSHGSIIHCYYRIQGPDYTRHLGLASCTAMWLVYEAI